jgi:hypothetical protein
MDETARGVVWEFVGIFESREEAVGFCEDEDHFVAPIVVGVRAPERTTAWPELEFPRGIFVDDLLGPDDDTREASSPGEASQGSVSDDDSREVSS